MSFHIKYKSHGQMSEAFSTVAFLTLSGGLQDAYTYVSRDHVFANAQTGNIILLSQSIFEQNWSSTLHYLVPLLFFALGVAITEMIRHLYQNAHRIHWRQLVLLIEMLLLLLVGFLPDTLNLLANALVSFSCAMQVQAFRKVNGYAFASTMCIGNIRSGMEAFCTYCQTHNKQTLYRAVCYFFIIFLFAFGAGIGSCFIPVFGLRTIWLSCLLLFISFGLMFLKEEKSS